MRRNWMLFFVAVGSLSLAASRSAVAADKPARAEGVPGRVCSTTTRPGEMDTTLPNPF